MFPQREGKIESENRTEHEKIGKKNSFLTCSQQVNTVNESTVEEAVVETVTNIGSTHVLGQHLKESTLTVVNGVVQGRGKQV